MQNSDIINWCECHNSIIVLLRFPYQVTLIAGSHFTNKGKLTNVVCAVIRQLRSTCFSNNHIKEAEILLHSHIKINFNRRFILRNKQRKKIFNVNIFEKKNSVLLIERRFLFKELVLKTQNERGSKR